MRINLNFVYVFIVLVMIAIGILERAEVISKASLVMAFILFLGVSVGKIINLHINADDDELDKKMYEKKILHSYIFFASGTFVSIVFFFLDYVQT